MSRTQDLVQYMQAVRRQAPSRQSIILAWREGGNYVLCLKCMAEGTEGGSVAALESFMAAHTCSKRGGRDAETVAALARRLARGAKA